MHPILLRPRLLGLYLLAWLPIAGVLAAFLVLAGDLTALEAGVLSVPLSVVYAFVCLSAWYVCRSFPPGGARPKALAGTLACAAAVASFLWLTVMSTLTTLMGLFPGFETLSERLAKPTPVVLLLGLLLYGLAFAIHYAVVAADRSRTEERRRLEQESRAREAELEALKAQLNPHFLFNGLNSVSALTSVSPERAREMCALLADFLRRALGLGGRSRVPLREELDLLRSYLAVEKVRFGDRIEMTEEIRDEVIEATVPALLLQPLVENAVRHGLGRLSDGGAVRLLAQRVGGRLDITLENPVDPDVEPTPGAGIGLANVRKRLAASYGDDAEMKEHRAPGLFRVHLSLPLAAEAA